MNYKKINMTLSGQTYFKWTSNGTLNEPCTNPKQTRKQHQMNPNPNPNKLSTKSTWKNPSRNVLRLCRFLHFGTNFRVESSNSSEQKMGLHFFSTNGHRRSMPDQWDIWGRIWYKEAVGTFYSNSLRCLWNCQHENAIDITWDDRNWLWRKS